MDLLAKVRLRGQETFILIHVENQASPRLDFPKRMFQYFSLLHGKFVLPIYPIAIFSYDRPLTPAEDRYEIELFEQSILRFQFQAIQLNRLNWREFLGKPNPVASALMTKMSIAPEDRPRVKLECLRMLATLKLDLARTGLIGVFMNSYLKLTAAEINVYNQELQAVSPEEKENVMDLVKEWKVALELEARADMVARQLRHRFGELPTDVMIGIHELTSTQVDDFGEALLDFKTLADAQAWLNKA